MAGKTPRWFSPLIAISILVLIALTWIVSPHAGPLLEDSSYLPLVSRSPLPTRTPTPEPTLECPHETVSVELELSAASIQVGQSLQANVTLSNLGCVALGLPQYRIYLHPVSDPPLVELDPAEPVVHYLAVQPGGSDSAEFTLTGLAAGTVGISASVSYEVHLGYPGPAYWGYAGSGDPVPLQIEP